MAVTFFCVDQLLLDLLAFREQALRLILDLSSTVITLLVSSKNDSLVISINFRVVLTRTLVWLLIFYQKQDAKYDLRKKKIYLTWKFL